MFGVLAVVIGAGIYVPTSLLADVPDAAAAITQPVVAANPAAAPVFPDFGRSAVGAVGWDGALATSGDQTPFPIASITKIVTALVVLEAKPLGADEAGPDITFTDDDVDIYNDVLAQNGSLEDVEAGLTLTQRQTMETMLIPSANNYAESLAIWAYGSVDSYLSAARAFLDAHGLTDTTIVDTNGLSAGDTSTPTNLIELGKLALASPVIASIVAMPSAEEPFIGTIENTNDLLGVDGIDGIKTGTTDEAGACLLFANDVQVGSQTVTLVGVILGAEDHDVLDERVAPLLDSVAAGFHEVTLTTAGQQYASYSTEWGEKANAVSTETKTALVWSDTPVTAALSASPVESATEGAQVGQIDFTVGATKVTVPLDIDATIEAPDTWWKLTHPGR